MTTRRDFLVAASVLTGGGALSCASLLVPAREPSSGTAVSGGEGADAPLVSGAAVVAFFDGQLWLDSSGVSLPYRPPAAARAMPSFTDEDLIWGRGYI